MKHKGLLQSLLLGVVLAAALPAAAQQAVMHEDRPALKFDGTSAMAPGVSGVTYVDSITRGGETAFRFLVRHIHEGHCQGFLYLTRTRIAYEPVDSPDFRAHAFDVLRTELKEAKPETSPFGRYWSLNFQKEAPAAASFVPLFDFGAASGRPLHQPADSAPLSALFVRVVGGFDAAEQEFQLLTAALRPQPQAVPGGGVGQSATSILAYTPRPPEANITEPAETEVKQDKIRVKGVAFDPSGLGIRSIEVMGQMAAMKPMRGGHAMEFWVDDVPLQAGENRIEIVVTNVSDLQGRTTIRVRRLEAETAKAQPESLVSQPLSVEDVIKALDGGLTRTRILTIVKERGVNFAVTPEIKSRLRAAGADPGFIDELGKAKR